jgi:hypothetical protein
LLPCHGTAHTATYQLTPVGSAGARQHNQLTALHIVGHLDTWCPALQPLEQRLSLASIALSLKWTSALTFSPEVAKDKFTGGAFWGPLEHTQALVDHTTRGKFPTTTPAAMSPLHRHPVQLLSLVCTRDSFARPSTTQQAGWTSRLVLLCKAQQWTNTPVKRKWISLVLFQDFTCRVPHWSS